MSLRAYMQNLNNFKSYLENIFKARSKSSLVSIPKDCDSTFAITMVLECSKARNCSSFSIDSKVDFGKLQKAAGFHR